MKIAVIIPARYNSTRLEGKPLIDIKGMSMIKRVYSQARLILGIKSTDIYITTDDYRIRDEVLSFTQNCIIIDEECSSGTQRCIKAYYKLNTEYDLVINIQGDVPFIHPKSIEELIIAARNSNYPIYTLYKKEKLDILQYKNTNVVKVVFNKKREAMYFSRLPIPYNGLKDFNKHIGVYAFRPSILKELLELEDGYLQTCEDLEQLNWLVNGYQIKMVKSEFDTPSVDTKEDLEKLNV